ncbi:MAG TPA: outer membrane beta-barrel protein, partial [Thermoanaerobaculia bacterium]|nr:outer membrane beta-barrel protein [Thermoanaerobaculia bacterium]
SADKRFNWTTTWITGPEQPDDVRDYRTLLTSYLTANLDAAGKWTTSSGGHYGWEANAARNPATGLPETARWYGATINLFRAVSPEVRVGTRLEWFRDAEGTRTALLGRPGFSADFFEATLGATWKPLASVSLRPEARLDWSPDSRPYNDQLDRTQLTLAADLIWKF